jgi:hypothetical protein
MREEIAADRTSLLAAATVAAKAFLEPVLADVRSEP